jgi:hypothetical protein
MLPEMNAREIVVARIGEGLKEWVGKVDFTQELEFLLLAIGFQRQEFETWEKNRQ